MNLTSPPQETRQHNYDDNKHDNIKQEKEYVYKEKKDKRISVWTILI